MKSDTVRSLAAVIEDRLEVSLAEMRRASKHQRISHARKVIAHVAREYGYRGKEIADYLEKVPVSVTMFLRPDEDVSKTAAALLKHVERVKNINNEV